MNIFFLLFVTLGKASCYWERNSGRYFNWNLLSFPMLIRYSKSRGRRKHFYCHPTPSKVNGRRNSESIPKEFQSHLQEICKNSKAIFKHSVRILGANNYLGYYWVIRSELISIFLTVFFFLFRFWTWHLSVVFGAKLKWTKKWLDSTVLIVKVWRFLRFFFPPYSQIFSLQIQ